MSESDGFNVHKSAWGEGGGDAENQTMRFTSRRDMEVYCEDPRLASRQDSTGEREVQSSRRGRHKQLQWPTNALLILG